MTTPLGPTDPDDPIALRLRETLHREADMVRPSDDGYERITTRLDREGRDDRPGRPSWVAWVVGVAAAVVVGTVAGVLVIDGADDDGDPVATSSPTPSTSSTPPPSSSSEPTTSAPSTTTATGGELDAVPVYWVGDSKVDSWLYREFQTVPDVGGELKSAVQQAMSGDPLDPDYRTAWSEPSSLEVTRDGDAITVDVSADAFANGQVGSKEALLAVQQVVWTATAAAGSPGPVTILVDGGPSDAWGAVALGEPMTRDVALQPGIWLDTPNEGAEVPAGTVTVSGVSRAFEGTIQWEVVDTAGTVVQDGFTQGGANETFAPFEIEVDLQAGEYVVHVWDDDESDGESAEGPRIFEQTRAFTVR
jgi:hypothetical protein